MEGRLEIGNYIICMFVCSPLRTLWKGEEAATVLLIVPLMFFIIHFMIEEGAKWLQVEKKTP